MAAGAKVGTATLILAIGFSHVSDDDFARAVIAQGWADAPRLDPSGTSWLPLPFWTTGVAMLALGRSLATARAVAIAMGAASVAVVFAGMRAAGLGRGAAMAAVAMALAVPLDAWLGAATVPDGPTGALIAAAALMMPCGGARHWGAMLLLTASLSRYEAWPVCAAFAAFTLAATRTERDRGRAIGAAAVSIAGPIAWMAWNARAHGDPLHFFARVARYRAALGAQPASLGDRLLGFPAALIAHAPVLSLAGVAGGMVLAVTRPPLASRLAPAGAAMLAMLVFLVTGDVTGGAPTHHPERALLAIDWVLAATAAAGAATLIERATALGARVAAIAALALVLAGSARGWSAFPGRGEERRDTQIARGRALRESGVAQFTVTPCRYEHFALIAAFGAPERVQIEPAQASRECPVVRSADPPPALTPAQTAP